MRPGLGVRLAGHDVDVLFHVCCEQPWPLRGDDVMGERLLRMRQIAKVVVRGLDHCWPWFRDPRLGGLAWPCGRLKC